METGINSVESPVAERSARKKVLIIDDDLTLTDLLALVFEDAGYQPIVAHSGREGIRLAVQEQPDVIILDIMMPEMDGFEVCDHLLAHERTSRIPIIFLTAKGSVEDQLQGWYRGCFDYIVKPFEVQDLLAAVKRALTENPEEVRRLQEELRRQKIVALEQIVHDGTE